MTATNKYESMIIFSVANGDESTKSLVEKFKALIEENGTIESFDEWGSRRLAYLINDEPAGYYVLINFTSEPEFIAELDRRCNITDGVLRILTVKKA